MAFGRVLKHKAQSLHVSPPEAKPVICLRFNKIIIKDLDKFRNNKGRSKNVNPRWP